MSAEFEDYFNQVESLLSDCVGGNDRYALKLAHNNYFRVKAGFYEDENPEDVSKELCMSVNESVNKGMVTCNKCGWEWKVSEGGKDTYDCHKCGNKKNNLNESVLTEGSKTDLPVRTIVRQMTDLIKLKMDDTFYLPEELDGDEMEYYFPGLPSFSVEFSTEWDPTLEQEYLLDGRTVDDGDVIEIELKANPSLFPGSLYDIIGDLNETLRHEIEHVMQDAGYRSSEEIRIDDEPTPTDKTYYMQKHEIPAEIKGFRRLVRLRKQPVEYVIKSWFERNRPLHNLPDEDIEELTIFLTKKYKEYYGG
jgi:hypothetical protein